MEKRRRSLWQAIKAFFSYLDAHSPAEVFGGWWRRAARAFGRLAGRTGRLSDPLVLSLIVGAALIAGGFALIGFAWRGAGATLLVSVQLAYFVSGGLGGLALVFLGVAVLHIQGLRWIAARERSHMERVRSKAELILEAASSHRGSREA